MLLMSKQDKFDKVNDYILQCLSSNELPEDKFICPHCFNKLQVQFEVYTRGKKKLVGILVECHTCDITIASDMLIDKVPKWLKDNHRR
jgi:hypothetical protein